MCDKNAGLSGVNYFFMYIMPAESSQKLNKAYRPNAHLLYIVMHYNGNII